MLLRAFVGSCIPVKWRHTVISNMKLGLINKTTTFIFRSRELAYPFMRMQKDGLQSGGMKMATEESQMNTENPRKLYFMCNVSLVYQVNNVLGGQTVTQWDDTHENNAI